MSPKLLQDRLTRFGILVCLNLRKGPSDLVSDYLFGQLIRSSTSPAANYSEATDAESRRDFIHKMKLCLKELRETSAWLRFKQALVSHDASDDAMMKECEELIAIFVASLKTARG